jgi:hypothetical protein
LRTQTIPQIFRRAVASPFAGALNSELHQERAGQGNCDMPNGVLPHEAKEKYRIVCDWRFITFARAQRSLAIFPLAGNEIGRDVAADIKI